MLPVLYSFRRCPYAMRARLALDAGRATYELREVSLRNKPVSMLKASPKGSVPVLVLPDGRVIDESWDIMLWSLHRHDPEGWLGESNVYAEAAGPMIIENDTTFKRNLDRYKYPDRYPDHTQTHYRKQGEAFLQDLEGRLRAMPYLLGDTQSIADAGIFPFVRQFAGVDKIWFELSPYVALRQWLNDMSNSERFAAVMKKYPPWQPNDAPIIQESKPSRP